MWKARPRSAVTLRRKALKKKLGVADADGLLQHCFKHGLKIAGRAADDLEYLRGGSLLLQ